ncbi:MAG: glycosyltransferase [Oscillospiraceae bacterium]|nr:glycosyltransferase [Oscillospiraceae bacterium]
MIIQNLLFPSFETCMEQEMYFRLAEETEFFPDEKIITFTEDGYAYFDTYFNSLSIEKWTKYTNVKNVSLSIAFSGRFTIKVVRKEKLMDRIAVEILHEEIISTEEGEKGTFSFETDITNMRGMLCFELFALEDGSEYYGGSYNTDIPDSDLNKVKLAIDICTYRREQFVENNLKLISSSFLNNNDSFLKDKLEVFISDNAKTLDIDRLSDTNIHIVQNKNAGGAGGFTRGMIEIFNAKEKLGITHILVMDDDIVIEPESIYRTCVMFALAKEAYKDAFIGGAMLRLDDRYRQTESGATWNSGYLVSLKGGLDLRTMDACLFNEIEETPQFNAWWYCAFPVDVVTESNLPMPIFIRGDDVEYGLRNMKHLILMNGICVWHEPFENKYSSFLSYYILRNRLIDNSLHNMTIPVKEFLRLMYCSVHDEVRLYRYKNAHLLMQGVEDFLKGVDWLKQQDGEKLHQQIMQQGYKMQYIEDIEPRVTFVYPLYEQSLRDGPDTSLKARIVNKLTTNAHCLSAKRGYNIVPTVGAQQTSVRRTDLILNYDFSSRKGFLTPRDPKEAKVCLKRLAKLNKLVKKNYYKAIKDYAENSSELRSLDYWKRYLDI